MKELKITIPGTPLGKKRARHSARFGVVRTYDTQEYELFSFCHALLLAIGADLSQIPKVKTLRHFKIAVKALNLASVEPLMVDLTFEMPICDSSTKAKRKAKLEGLIKHTIKPDLDNLEKFVLDCGNGILWKDDSQIIALSSRKVYSENPQTHITLKECH